MGAQKTIAAQTDIKFQANLYEDANPTRRQLHRTRRDWILHQFMPCRQKGQSVLEVGIGCGVFTRSLAQAGFMVRAIDINADFVRGVALVPNVVAIEADGTQPGVMGSDFDLALCSEVLEHVPPASSLAMLRHLHDALRPGGLLILSTPQRFSAVELAARSLKLPPVLWLARRIYGHANELGHINLLTRRALVSQVEAAGFSIEQHECMGLYLPIIAEFCGEWGARLLKALAHRMQGSRFEWLLWTQALVLRRPPVA
jgi:SAM-dependent methyltransferase